MIIKCLCVSLFYTSARFTKLLSFYGTKTLRTAMLPADHELHNNAYHIFAPQIYTFKIIYQTMQLMKIFYMTLKTIDVSSLLKIVNNYCMRVVEIGFEKKIYFLRRVVPYLAI